MEVSLCPADLQYRRNTELKGKRAGFRAKAMYDRDRLSGPYPPGSRTLQYSARWPTETEKARRDEHLAGLDQPGTKRPLGASDIQPIKWRRK